MSRPGLSITACLTEISLRLTEAAAIAKAALACAEAGAEREGLRIAMDLDVPLSEAGTLHAAACLIGSLERSAECRSERSAPSR